MTAMTRLNCARKGRRIPGTHRSADDAGANCRRQSGGPSGRPTGKIGMPDTTLPSERTAALWTRRHVRLTDPRVGLERVVKRVADQRAHPTREQDRLAIALGERVLAG